MKKISVCCIILFNWLFVIGQPDIDKLEQLKNQLKLIQKTADSMNNAVKSRSVKEISTRARVNASATTITNMELPEIDTSRINGMSKRVFTVVEMRSYLKDLYLLMTKKLPPGVVGNANAIEARLGSEPLKLEAAAFYALASSRFGEASLLITRAGIKKTDDVLLLTNAGAILDVSGLSDKAIPILRTVATNDPANGIAANNLGQAYIALGMVDSARACLMRCLQLSPEHPEANNTLGQIELVKGSKARAKTYFENSIRGGFNQEAYQGLASIDKKNRDLRRIRKLITPKIKYPEYFNLFKYDLPRQCGRVEDATAVEAEYQLFRDKIKFVTTKYRALLKAAEVKVKNFSPEAFNNEMLEKIKNNKPVVRPFQVMAGIVAGECQSGFALDLKDLLPFIDSNRRQYDNIKKQYQTEYDSLIEVFKKEDKYSNCCGEGDVSCCEDPAFCNAQNNLKNKFLPQLAEVNIEWQRRQLHVIRNYFEDLLYFEPLSAIDSNQAAVIFYGRITNYLDMISTLAQTTILKPCKVRKAAAPAPPKDTVLPQFDACDLSLGIKFIVGKFSLDCQKFSIEGGEGVLGKAEYNFTSRQLTLSVGVGFYAGVGENFANGRIKAGAEAGLSSMVYLNIDKGLNVTDGGIINKIGASASAGVNFEDGQKRGFQRGLGDAGIELTSNLTVTRLGINSGYGGSVGIGPLTRTFTGGL